MDNEKILVIDDDESALRMMRRRLEREGYTDLFLTSSPEEGLIKFDTWDPDLLILDLNMPTLDGFQVLTALRQRNPDQLAETPVLILTGEGGQDNKLHALSLGARDFLSKPFDPAELSMRVKGNLQVRKLLMTVSADNVQLELRIRARTAELEKANLEIIQRLMAAAEYRDDDTGSHIGRISKYSALLAQSLKLDETAQEMIRRASPMHDLGKIGIPDRILLKPGKLTPEEWEVMKTHSQIGADLLSNSVSQLLNMAEEIALTHHEKWNGMGYPRGLKQTEIPVSGRIVAVVDVFDALTSERPYKQAWPTDRALEVLRSDSGTHFDPEIVEAFFEILPQILAVKESLTAPIDSSQLT